MTAKHAMFFALFTQGRVTIMLDARRSGVDLPGYLRASHMVALTYGNELPIPTNDVYLDDAGIRCTLSFNQTPTATFVPWAAIYAIEGIKGHGIQFEDDVPAEVRAAAAAAAEKAAQAKPEPAADARPRLGLVPLEAAQDGADEAAPLAPAAGERPVPTLTVVPKAE